MLACSLAALVFVIAATSCKPQVNDWVDDPNVAITSRHTPRGVSLTAGDGEVLISWTPTIAAILDGVTYTISRSVISGEEYTIVASGMTGTSHMDSGLTNGTTYYYVVTAVSQFEAANTSPASGEVSATPTSSGGVPSLDYTGAAGTSGTAGTAMSVTPTTLTANGSAITACAIKAGSANAGLFPVTLSVNATTCVISGTPTATLSATTFTLIATNASGDSADATVSLTITFGAASKVAFSTQPNGALTSIQAFSTATAPAVQIQDANGNVVTSATDNITLAAYTTADCSTTAGTGTVTNGTQAAVAGAKTFSTGIYTKAETIYLKATVAGLTTACSTGTFVVSAAAASKVAFSTQPAGSITAGANFSTGTAPTVQIQDTNGNLVSSASDNITITAYSTSDCSTTAGTGTLSNGVQAASSGAYTFSTGTYTAAQTVYLKAAVTGLTTACSTGTFVVSAAAASKVGFSVQPSGSPALNAAFTSFTAQIQDTYGNRVTGSTATISLVDYTSSDCSTTPGAGTLTNDSLAATAGNSAFTTTTYDTALTIYLKASSAGLTDACSTGTVGVGAAVYGGGGGSGPAQIIAGNNLHFCAVVNGGVKCWGENSSGENGDGTTVDRNSPVSAIAQNSGATGVSTGETHTCAIVDQGVKCWGYGNNGQLGDGGTSPSNSAVVAIANHSGATWIGAGREVSCAVVNGGVKCWGANTHGQVGDGSTTQRNSPVAAIASNSGAVQVAAGIHFACAVVSGGVKCWGDNVYGQLGDGSNTDSTTPVTAITSGSGVTHLFAKGDSACAVVNGGVKCWGRNQKGELGDGSTTNRNAPVTTIASSSGVSIVGGGEIHRCAVIYGGTKCWGSNASGGLKDGTTTDRTTPVVSYSTGSGITSFDGGGYWGSGGPYELSCAVINGGVSCWGNHANYDSGQLGDGGTVTSAAPVTAIATNSGVDDFNQGINTIANGFTHTCILVNGGVKCVGDNTNGNLGDGSTANATTPVTAIAAGSGVIAVSAGDHISCAVINGGVKCWGTNYLGLVGDGSGVEQHSPVTVIAADSGVTSIAGSGQHVCVVINGGLKCWGGNANGQIGDGSTTNRSTPVTVIAANSGVTAVATGREFTCGLVNSGVQCWGRNSSSHLGDGTTTEQHSPITTIAINSGVTHLSSANSHSCVVLYGGLYCWGLNGYGQFGDGSVTARTTPTLMSAMESGWSRVFASYANTCGVRNGGVSCSGYNWTGALGDGSTTESHSFVVPIATSSGAIDVSGSHYDSYNQSCAILASGVKCWGDNNSGQLGDGTTTDRLSPVSMIGIP